MPATRGIQALLRPPEENRIARLLEPAATMASSMAAEPVSGIAALLTGNPENVQRVQQALTYNPRSREGQEGLKVLSETFQQLTEALGVDEATKYFEQTIVPNLQQKFGDEAGSAMGAMAMGALAVIPAGRAKPNFRSKKIINADGDLVPRPTSMTEVPEIRNLDVESATKVARGEPHLIPSNVAGEGAYTGGPRNIKNRKDLLAMRRDLDETIARGAEGGDWYDRYRDSVRSVTGNNSKDNQWMSALEGQYSAGVSPESELAFALKDTNSAIAQGTPVKAARPAQQQASINAIEQNDPSKFQLGPKTGEYARIINPAAGAERTATGVNDFRHARNIGYTEVSGAAQREGLSPQAHRFMDHETALAVDRANQSNLGGRSDWKGEQVQAAPWVAQKADDLYKRQKKGYQADAANLIKENGLNEPLEVIAKRLAFNDANKTIGDHFDKHTAFGTHEPQPYVDAQHLEGLAKASPEEKLAFANDLRSRWDNAPGGRDAIYAGTRLGDTGYAVRTRPTTEMQGIYDPPNGAKREFNPGFVARPMVAFDSGKVKSIPDADRSLLDAGEATRAYIDVQGAGAWHKPWVGGQTGQSNSLVVSRDGPSTIEQMEALQEIGKQRGLGDVVDTGQGYTMTDFYNGAPQINANALKEILSEIADVAPDSTVTRAKVDSGYLSMFEDVTPGSGQATEKLMSALDAVPSGTREAMNNNPAIPKAALDRIARDKEMQTKYGTARSDIQKAREIIGKGPGWIDRLQEAAKKGVILPSLAAGILAFGASQDLWIDDQQT